MNRLGGIELAKAYTCIKAISKKKESLIAENAEKFLQGAVANGLSKQQANDFWQMILKFAGYGFNKSHSTAYALIAYQTAYLKAHYSLEFMAALLTGDIPERNFKRKDSLVEHLEDCKRMGVPVDPPNVNRGESDFTVVDNRIQFGLAAMKGCGGSAAEAIVAERKANGPFRDIFDFCERVDPAQCSRASIEALIKAGALDCLGGKRSQLLAALDRAMQTGASRMKDKKSGQMSLFGAIEEDVSDTNTATVVLPEMAELPEKELLAFEKEVLGYYLTAHPLSEYMSTLNSLCSHTTATIKNAKHRSEVMMGGIISAIKLAHTRNPKPGVPTKYANFDLEDVDGNIRCIMWPDGFEKKGEFVQHDTVVLVRATVDRKGESEEANLIVNDIIPIAQADAEFTSGIRIQIEEDRHNEGMITQLREILRGYPGKRAVDLAVKLCSGEVVFVKTDKHRVDISPELRIRLDDLLGPNSHRLITARPTLKAAEPYRRHPARAK